MFKTTSFIVPISPAKGTTSLIPFPQVNSQMRGQCIKERPKTEPMTSIILPPSNHQSQYIIADLISHFVTDALITVVTITTEPPSIFYPVHFRTTVIDQSDSSLSHRRDAGVDPPFHVTLPPLSD